MNSATSILFTAMLDIVIILLFFALIAFVIYQPTSTGGAAKKTPKHTLKWLSIVNIAIVGLLMLWLVIVIINPSYGGQSLVPGSTPPTATPIQKPIPTQKPSPTPPVATPTPKPIPTQKPASTHTPHIGN